MVATNGHQLGPRIVGCPDRVTYHGHGETIAAGHRCPIEVIDPTASAGHDDATVWGDRQHSRAIGHGVSRQLSTSFGIELDHERS